MATLHDHAEKIRAAIDAAVADGYELDFEVYYNSWDDSINSIDFNIKKMSRTGEGSKYVTYSEVLLEVEW